MSEMYRSAAALEEGAGAEEATRETFAQLDDLLAQVQAYQNRVVAFGRAVAAGVVRRCGTAVRAWEPCAATPP